MFFTSVKAAMSVIL